jgi:hypothetical protein
MCASISTVVGGMFPISKKYGSAFHIKWTTSEETASPREIALYTDAFEECHNGIVFDMLEGIGRLYS